jgi:hypothetical protein
MFSVVNMTAVPHFEVPPHVQYVVNKKVIKPKIKGDKKHGN